jgi:translation initiation factor 3 subunit I
LPLPLQQPILLKGHERSITQVKFNNDGDLLFTTSKDNKPTAWFSDNGERFGTYGGHKGAVWDIDPSWDSKYVLTAGADGSARLYECETGRAIVRMPHKGAVRCVSWGEGNQIFATASDPFTTRERGCISIFEFPSEDVLAEQGQGDVPAHTPILEINVDDLDKATYLNWTAGNEYIIAGFDSGLLVKYDPTTGEEVQRIDHFHTGRINRVRFNKDKTLFVTASKDQTAKLVDPITFEVIKTYKPGHPVNDAVISPLHPHVLLGGGQDAMSVTVTSGSQGKFECRFYHMIYEEEFGRVKGHFGPINAIAMHPNGVSYASGSEDGFVRLHHFDPAYLNMPDYVPEAARIAE